MSTHPCCRALLAFAALTTLSLSAKPALAQSPPASDWRTHPSLLGRPAPLNTWLGWRASVRVDDERRARFPLRIATDGKYWLFVDGRLAVREGGLKQGPTPTGLYADTVDIAPFLRSDSGRGADTHRLELVTWHFGKPGFSHRESGRAALLVEPLDARPLGARWGVVRHPAFGLDTVGAQPNYRLPERNAVFDARLGNRLDYLPAEASGALLAPGSAPFTAAVPLDTVLGPLTDRPIPQWKDFGLRRYTNGHVPAGYVSTGDTLVLTLPYNAQVTPFFLIDAPAGGMRVDVRTDNFRGGGPPNVRFAYLTRPGRQAFEVPAWMNGHAVRYHFPAGIKVEGLSFRESGYATERAGGFSSSDADLDTLWEKSARTLYITMRDSYMDCPDRERAQWWGDVVIELGEAFYAFDSASTLLARKGLLELMAWQRPDSTIFSPVPAGNWGQELPMQMLASVGEYGLWTYFRFSGDTALVEELYPAVRRYLHVWQVDSVGLVVPRQGGWTWGDWGERKDLYLLYQGWYALALEGFEHMARLTAKPADAAWARDRRERLREAVRSRFWRKPTGKTPGGYATPDFPHAPDDRVQALAVLNDWATPEQYPALRQNLQTVYQASPYMERYVLEALFAMGYDEDAVARMKRRYRAMIDSELTTLWEGWGIGAEGYGGGTYNHAWSGGPLTLLSQRIAGLEPAIPGWGTYRLSPKLSGLDSVSAYAPTPAGTIRIAWTCEDGTTIGKLEAPSQLLGELVLRKRSDVKGQPHVKVDGQRLKSKENNGRYVYALPPGAKLIAIK